MTTTHPAIPVTPPQDDPEGARRGNLLQALLTRLVDARDGLDAMIARAEPEITPILRKIREDHHESASRVAALIVSEGQEPDLDGSLMSTVNKAVVSIRALFDDVDDDALVRVIDGEQHVIDAYDDAAEAYQVGHVRNALFEMRRRLASLLDEARGIAA